MDKSTIEKLFNLRHLKDVYCVTITQANRLATPITNVSVHIDGKQPGHVLRTIYILEKINEIIPNLTFEFGEPYSRNNGQEMDQWCSAETKDIEVTIFTSWEKEKAPTSDGSRKENTHLDNTTEWSPEQILRNEG